MTSTLSIGATLYPNKVGSMVGICVSVFAIGSMLGPSIGEFLAMLGGFPIPFFTVGAAYCGHVVVMSLFLPKKIKPMKDDSEEDDEKKELLDDRDNNNEEVSGEQKEDSKELESLHALKVLWYHCLKEID